jgi:cell division protein FtsL
LLDRLIRGRAWIPVLGVLLAGIVAMRVEVLKLGVSVGRSLAVVSQLQSENQTLRANVASLSNAARIERLAATMGMVMPGPLDVHFIAASGANDLGAAVAGIVGPDPTTFEAGLQTQAAANSASISAFAAPATTSGTSSSTATVATTPSSTAVTTAGG